MEFNRKGLCGGLEIDVSVDNGRAFFEIRTQLQKAVAEQMLEEVGVTVVQGPGSHLDIRIWDRDGRQVFGSCYPLRQEEAAKGLILHPHLWQGTEDPYLYRVQVSLMEKHDCVTDTIEATLAFRNFCEIPRKGYFLNDRPFEVRSVEYEIPAPSPMSYKLNRNFRKLNIRRDLELMVSMGANAVCPIGDEADSEFCRLCDEAGLLVWRPARVPELEGQTDGVAKEQREAIQFPDIPHFHGREDSLLTLHGNIPTSRFYYYKACWSKSPFVYIDAGSLVLQENGNAQVTVYSNQKKVALYVEGVLFEFKSEGPDFLFQEIPVRHLPLMLTAEAGECSMSVTAYPE